MKKDKIIGIYKITSPSGKIYIGQSRNMEKRWRDYMCLASCKDQTILYNSFLYYGQNNHIYEKIEECILELLDKRERYWQEYYNAVGPSGLNCFYTETDEKPRIVSEETLAKMSEASKGRLWSEERRARQMLIIKNRTPEQKFIISEKLKGRKHSEETRKKISEKLTGRAVNQETKLKISLANKGKKRTEEVKKQQRLRNLGKTYSKEVCLKKSELFKGRVFSDEWKDNIRKAKLGKSSKARAIIDLDTNSIYKSFRAISDLTEFNRKKLSKMLNGEIENTTNFRFLDEINN